ncbi:hypothetical protein LA345_16110 [Burkholderia vietnamiensis]|nr:hypothetical protein [Burkholderia vietnamiensis]
MRFTALLLMLLYFNVFAETKTKNIQVSATILPYCLITVENGQAKNVCRGYEKTKAIPATIIKEDGKLTIQY